MSDTTQQDRKAGSEPEVVIKTTEDGGAVVTGLPASIDDVPLVRERTAGRDPDEENDDGQGSAGGEKISDNRRRRQRQREKREQSQQQIAELSTVVMSQQRMLQALTRGQQQAALATLEREAADTRAAYAEAQRRHAAAVTAGDGAAATEAQTVMTNTTAYYGNVKRQYDGLVAHIQKTPIDDGGADDGSGAPVPARTANGDGRPVITAQRAEKIDELREAFLDAHPYIDLERNDPKTVAFKAIDTEVAREGFKPWTQDYWDEVAERAAEAGLTKAGGKRVERREPDDYEERPARRAARRREPDDDDGAGGPPLGGDGRGPARRDGEFTLAPELVASLEAIGIPIRGGTPEQGKRRNKIIQEWRDSPLRSQARR